MKKILTYTNINLALHDKFMFGRNFVKITLTGKESPEKVQEAYDYIRYGIIKSEVAYDGIVCNKLIIKKGKQYLPDLVRTDMGLLTIAYKQFDKRLLHIENGKLYKNVILGEPGLTIKYNGIELEIPNPAPTEDLHVYEGRVYDKHSYLVTEPKAQSNIIDLVSAPKNVILNSDTDYKRFEKYREKLTNYTINGDGDAAINVYMTYKTFYEFGDETKVSLFPGKHYRTASYLQNVAKLNKVLKADTYWFEIKAAKPMYVIDASKKYRGVEYLPLGYLEPINDSILIFESIKVARNYRDYFKDNQIVINNKRDYKSVFSNLGLHEYTKSIYIAGNDLVINNHDVKTVNRVVRKVIEDDNVFYQLKGYYINNLDPAEVAYLPGNLGGGYLFKQIPQFVLESDYVLLEDEVTNAKQVSDVHDRDKYSQQYEYALVDNCVYKTKYLKVAYIFDMYIDNDDIVINVFNHGYRVSEFENEIHYKGDFEVTDCPEYIFYSKYSSAYPNNYKTVRFKNTKSAKFHIIQNGERCSIRFSKHVRANMKRNGLQISVFAGNVKIVPISKVKQSKFEKQMANTHVESYLFMDRGTSAGDNGEHIYRHYLHNDQTRNHYYVLSKDSADWERLSAEGFNLVEYLSDEHKRLFLTADKIVTSHLANRIFNPFFPSYEYTYLIKSKIIFLQHGITIANHRGFLDRYSRPLDLFICGAVEEQEQVQAFSQYPNVQCTGFARFDRLRNERAGYLLYAPSWNTIYRDNFVGSEYHNQVQAVLENQQINQLLERNNLRLKLLLHPEFIGFSEYFTPSPNVDIIKPSEVNYNKFISEADMLITDYSSLYFDFLYQEKQVILHQPYELHNATSILKQPENCVRKSYNVTELADSLAQIEQLNFESDKKDQILKFFGHVDKNNCQRIMDEIEKL